MTNRTLNTFCTIFKSKTRAICSNWTCVSTRGSCPFRAIITSGTNLTHFRGTVQSFRARFAGFDGCLIGKARVCSGRTRKLGIILRTSRAIVTSRTRVAQVGIQTCIHTVITSRASHTLDGRSGTIQWIVSTEWTWMESSAIAPATGLTNTYEQKSKGGNVHLAKTKLSILMSI